MPNKSGSSLLFFMSMSLGIKRIGNNNAFLLSMNKPILQLSHSATSVEHYLGTAPTREKLQDAEEIWAWFGCTSHIPAFIAFGLCVVFDPTLMEMLQSSDGTYRSSCEPAYGADIAKMEYELVAGEHGLVIRVNRLNRKIPVPQNCKVSEMKIYGSGWRFYDINYKKNVWSKEG
ncbi:uncharacterized protein FN964_010949 isoform 1-T1 [Alca torda]